MSCVHPLDAYELVGKTTDNGKRLIVFSRPKGNSDYSIMRLPCGQCIGCRIRKARDWAVRCVHEASMHEENCFITLTYNPQTLGDRKSLEKQDVPKFLKRLRKEVKKKSAICIVASMARSVKYAACPKSCMER